MSEDPETTDTGPADPISPLASDMAGLHELFLSFVEGEAIDYTVHPVKDSVKQWKSENEGDPPGITTSIFTKLNIRRS